MPLISDIPATEPAGCRRLRRLHEITQILRIDPIEARLQGPMAPAVVVRPRDMVRIAASHGRALSVHPGIDRLHSVVCCSFDDVRVLTTVTREEAVALVGKEPR